jgi:hypothetical protein
LLYADAVGLFGKCEYRPAIPYLLEYSLEDACMNIVDAGEDDLQKLYPNSPKGFNSLEAMRRYYCGRAKREGFHVDCVSK